MADRKPMVEAEQGKNKACSFRTAFVRSLSFLLSFLLFFPWCSCAEIRLFSKPPAPDLPNAGERFVDPTFKSAILRVTDRRDADMNYHVYSFWSPFNADSTRFWIMVGTTATLYELDPDRFRLASKRPLFGKIHLRPDCICWDTVNPKILYGIHEKRLYAMDTSTQPASYSMIKDFEGLLPAKLSFLTVSNDNRWFSFIVGSQDNNEGILGSYDAKTDTLRTCDLKRRLGFTNIHSVTIDKGGRFVWAAIKGNKDKLLWEIESGKVLVIKSDKLERAHGHRAMGTNTVYHVDDWEGGNIIKRDLNTPDKWMHILNNPGGTDWTHDAHISVNHRDESTIFVSRLTLKESPWKPLQDEIFQLWTDGTFRLRRLAHHRSIPRRMGKFGTYYSYPKAASSIDGRFVMFTSNWDGSPYLDVYALKVP